MDTENPMMVDINQANEEELRQSLEEMQTVQESLQQQIESNNALKADYEKRMAELQNDLNSKIRIIKELEKKLNKR